METNERVDVLAVMDGDVAGCGLVDGADCPACSAMRAARAAVAELIAADKALDLLASEMRRRKLAGPRPYSRGTGWELRDAASLAELEAKLFAAEKRRAAALARITPAEQESEP